MAIRNVLTEGNRTLRKISKEVKEITPRVIQLLEDMADTMYEEDGVGLAAPQVGVLKRIVVIDVGDGLLELINPRILKTEGEDVALEGCLSFPGKSGKVKRPAKVQVEAQDRYSAWKTYEGEGLLARAFCHEIDHLEGVLFVDKVIEDEENE